MIAAAFGLLVIVVGLWLFTPWLLAFAVGVVGGLFVGLSIVPRQTVTPAVEEAPPEDPEVERAIARLESMGFHEREYMPLIAKAQRAGVEDVAGYAMRSLIR